MRRVQKAFLADLRAGLPLDDVLTKHGLKWGNIAAWRRWTRGFREAHNRAAVTGREKRPIIRFAEYLLASDPTVQLVPAVERLVANARARALRPPLTRSRSNPPMADPGGAETHARNSNPSVG